MLLGKSWLSFIKQAVVLISVATATLVSAEEKAGSVWEQKKPAMAYLSAQERNKLESFSNDYRRFLHEARTETLAVSEIQKRAQAKGFKLFSKGMKVQPGARLFFSSHGRSLVLVHVGKEPIDRGFRMIASHLDSPRLELKGRPWYKKQKAVLLQTRIHGSVKSYQWMNIPLALVGEIHLTDGTIVPVRFGLDPKDPVLFIPDTAPHEDKKLREEKYPLIKTEDLDPVVGITSSDKDPLSELLNGFQTPYNVEEEDFVGAELSLVPAMEPREAGFDRSMIMGYGQDDKSSVFAALQAVLEQAETPRQTVIAYFADNEESGSQNNTGADSFFLREVIQQLLSGQGSGQPESLYQAMKNSIVISADTTTGINPTFAGSTQEETNASRLGFGVVVKLYASSKDANPQTYAQFRKLFSEYQIPWQTQTPHGDVGGGSTIGVLLSRQGMEVIDLGIAVFTQHAPMEVSSKADLYFFYRAIHAFLSTPKNFQVGTLLTAAP